MDTVLTLRGAPGDIISRVRALKGRRRAEKTRLSLIGYGVP